MIHDGSSAHSRARQQVARRIATAGTRLLPVDPFERELAADERDENTIPLDPPQPPADAGPSTSEPTMDGQALDYDLLMRVLNQTRRHEPQALAILINGSYARGAAAPSSDLDVHVISPSPLVPHRTWFEPRPYQNPLHVSLGTGTPQAWINDPRDAADWSLGFPAVNSAIYLWAEESTRLFLGEDPSQRFPAGEPQLEDFIEWVMKAKRASAAHDEIGLRWAAFHAALLAPGLLRKLNPERHVYDPRDALTAALELSVTPEGFADQLMVCLGLIPEPSARITQNVLTMAFNLLAYLREYAPNTDLQPHLAAYLRFGLLERHLQG